MKIYLKQNVFEAALERIRFLFDEFPQVIVNVSGGKDSTVVFNLAMMVAEEKGRLYPNQPVAHIAGVRCEESPGRMMGLTALQTYKDVTWGSKEDEKRGHYTFYPLYDWLLTDIWKAIHDNGWPYCRIYDYMYSKGVPIYRMRVSSFHHETSIKSLFFLQELEPDTWNRITARISGVDAAAKLNDDFYAPKELPFMFQDWREYRDHLLNNLVAEGEPRETMRRTFASEERIYDPIIHDELIKMHIKTILTNDYEGWGQSTFRSSHGRWLVAGRYGDGKKGDAGDKRRVEAAA
jgi:predicted phosphoadenosine phosphosulfate sulfurtransferase